jgi:hypothetical protein
VKIWPFKKGYTGNIHCSLIQFQALPLQLQENVVLSMVALQLRYRVHSVLCEFIANLNIVVAMKCCLEHDEIERQLKCKICM